MHFVHRNTEKKHTRRNQQNDMVFTKKKMSVDFFWMLLLSTRKNQIGNANIAILYLSWILMGGLRIWFAHQRSFNECMYVFWDFATLKQMRECLCASFRFGSCKSVSIFLCYFCITRRRYSTPTWQTRDDAVVHFLSYTFSLSPIHHMAREMSFLLCE